MRRIASTLDDVKYRLSNLWQDNPLEFWLKIHDSYT